MSIRKKIIRNIMILSIGISIPMLSHLDKSYANTNIENELKSVIQKYDQNSLEVEEGIALKIGENLDLSKYPNWELSNNEVVTIENGVLKTINEGTVFLSQQIGDKAYIVEVYVFEEEPIQSMDTKSNRDYYKVFIDPGHGGSDPGNTAGSSNGITEKVLNLKISTLVKDKLEAKGIQVKMSRTGDTFPSLSQRAEMANAYGGDIYVSIHQNSAGSTTSAKGIETFYHTDKIAHKPLSSDIQTNLIKETGATDRKVKNNNFAVLRLSNMPSSLVECGFMTNSSEYANLTNSTYQNKLATGIANGIVKYLNENIDLNNKPVPPPTGEIIATGKVKVESTDTLNVRSGYGASYAKIGTLKNGEAVNIYETKNNWHKIRYKDTTGYVSGSYVSIDKDETPEPPPVIPPTPEIETVVKGLIGEDRYETAVKISKEGWTSSSTVILVNGHDNHLVDGLTATPLAYVKNAPLLLAENNKLSTHTINEIKRLNPSKVIVIGGETAISNNVINEIKSISSSISVQRIGGEDRYETSLNIAKEIDNTNSITKIFVGAGNGEADALTISPVAARENSPIILTDKNGLSKNVYDYLKSKNVSDGYIIGGDTKISSKAIAQINEVVKSDISKNVIKGIDRQETNAKIIEKFYGGESLNGVVVAKEFDLVDALTVGPLAGKKDMPIVLATNGVSKAQENALNSKKSETVYRTGGGISDSAINKVKALVNVNK